MVPNARECLVMEIRRLALILFLQSTISYGQISLDGTLGPATDLTGPNYDITSDLGQTIGSNLFHSFNEFNLTDTESATFSGPNSIANILSRVTGGNPSSIDGLIRSTIPGANFFFLNPFGVMFGPNAAIDVDGAFTVSTADLIRLSDGGLFDATNPANSVLTAGASSSFGFLDSNPAGFTINNSLLNVADGESLSFIGGDTEIVGGQLVAPSGNINIVGVDSTGEVTINVTDPVPDINVDSFTQLGDISISDGSFLATNGDSGGNAGNIVISTNTLEVLNGTEISTASSGAGDSGSITVNAESILLDGQDSAFFTGLNAQSNNETVGGNAGNILLSTANLTILDGAEINTNTFGPGQGGRITVAAESVFLNGRGSNFFTGIQAQTSAGADGGDIIIDTTTLEILNKARIDGASFGSGGSGNISIAGETILIDGQGFGSGISAAARGKTNGGNGGEVTIQAGTLRIMNKGQINLLTEGSGNSGSLTIQAETFNIINEGFLIAASTGSGFGGDINIHAKTILFNGAAEGNRDIPNIQILAVTLNPVNGGKGGNITLHADTLELIHSVGITADTRGDGDAGSITINAESILLDGTAEGETGFGATIQALTRQQVNGGNSGNITVHAEVLELIGKSGFSVFTFGDGNGGIISVDSESILLDGRGMNAFISAGTGSVDNGGDSGNIMINTEELRIINNAQIGVTSFGSGDSGGIKIDSQILFLDAQGKNNGIIASTLLPINGGKGGDIILTIDTLEIINGSVISANSRGTGGGGNISVNAGSILLVGKISDSPTGINAQTEGEIEGGKGGDINIVTQALEIMGEAAEISVASFGSGDGGIITLEAESIVLDGQGASNGINASTDAVENAGQGGGIQITTRILEISDGARINANSRGSGNGGNINVMANSISIINTFPVLFTGILARTDTKTNGGAGGNITLSTEKLEIIGGGAGISVATSGSGNGGIIVIEAETILLDGHGLINGITASTDAETNGGTAGDIIIATHVLEVIDDASISVSSKGSGNAGRIDIDLRHSLELINASITTESSLANGGDVRIKSEYIINLETAKITAQANANGGEITLTAPFMIQFQDSRVTAEAGNDGGNITIDPIHVILDNSQLIANAQVGNGGDIAITSEVFLVSPDSLISASSQFGVSGNIDIFAPDVDIAGSLVTLSGSLLDAASQLQERCAVKLEEDVSSFVVVGRGGLPVEPIRFMPSFSAD